MAARPQKSIDRQAAREGRLLARPAVSLGPGEEQEDAPRIYLSHEISTEAVDWFTRSAF